MKRTRRRESPPGIVFSPCLYSVFKETCRGARGRSSRTPNFRDPEVPALVIPRKEVIQPQVLLRLPCYDLVPVTGLTVVASVLAVRSATLGTPGSHGLTGGVYKAQEHIHRVMADTRLLAIPASCRRVADDNPNLARLLAIGSLLRVRDALYQAL